MIPLFKVNMSEDVLDPLNKVLMSGFIGQGPKVEEFETILKNYFSNHLLTTLNSATSGLHLSLRLLKAPYREWKGLNDNDEVLATPLTCTATNFPILANNLKIKWVDVDPETCNMDLNDLARKISPNTKVIMPVHWGGYPNDLDKMKEIQDKCFDLHGFRPAIIEDCAHSFGSKYKDEYIGNYGNISVFSFQAIKHFTSGDGGVVLFPHQELYNRSKTLRWFGIDRETNSKDFRCEDDIAEWGYKFHMNDINATIGIYNFPSALTCVQKHKTNSKFYDEALNDVQGVINMRRDSWAESASWIHTIKVENRDGFMRYMKECEIMVSRVHERNDKHSCVREFKAFLPNLDMLSQEMICIPNGWWVSEYEKQYIVDCIKKGW
jgi:dTDP-4-amino-4,6-dideoxy-D-glucose/dTDP-4-amino-2,4-dideoxy-beta-L-xylose transaminase